MTDLLSRHLGAMAGRWLQLVAIADPVTTHSLAPGSVLRAARHEPRSYLS